MKLYRIKRTDKVGWDEFIGAVVAANSEAEARRMHPGGGDHLNNYGEWPTDLRKIRVTFLGEAAPDFDKPQVIMNSFNAG